MNGNPKGINRWIEWSLTYKISAAWLVEKSTILAVSLILNIVLLDKKKKTRTFKFHGWKNRYLLTKNKSIINVPTSNHMVLSAINDKFDEW